MSTIAFFCIPAHGHTNPTLGVVRELVSRGHRVVYYAYTPFREKIQAAGAEFVACDAYDREQQLTDRDRERIGSDLAFSMKVLVDTTLALDEAILADMKALNPDCIVADSMAVWGKAIARKLNIPFVSSTTTFAFNKEAAQIMGGSLKDLFSSLFGMMKAGKEIKRLQKKGYPFRNALDIISNDNSVDTVVYTSRSFQPCADSFSDRYEFVGPSIRPVQAPFEKTAPKLVYISMGTVVNDRLPLYRSCVEALRDTGWQVVISVGDLVDPASFGVLPENIRIFSTVDQIAVLEKADVFLTHCGMNSVSEALWFGVPLVMLPQTREQIGVCNRVLQLEAGVQLTATDPAAIRSSLETVLTEDRYRQNARSIGADFRRCSGPSGAADKILSVIP